LFVCTKLCRRWQVELDMMMGLVCTHNIDGVDDDGVWAHNLWSGEYVLGGGWCGVYLAISLGATAVEAMVWRSTLAMMSN
jgi:hypothetical protein